jgi:ankyrin repeat protein
VEALKQIFALDLDPNQPDNFGIAPVHKAAYKGYLEAIKNLVNYGALLDRVSNEGATPLHYACKGNQLEIVEYLLNQKVEIEIPDKEGKTPLFYAVYSPRITQRLLTEGAKVNMASDNFMTPLDYAISKGQVETVKEFLKVIREYYETIGSVNAAKIVKKLIKKGVMKNVCDRNGKTPLDMTYPSQIPKGSYNADIVQLRNLLGEK